MTVTHPTPSPPAAQRQPAGTSAGVGRVRATIVGAAGYTGAELAVALLAHPHAELVAAFGSARRAEEQPLLADLHPVLRGRTDLRVAAASPEAIAASGADVVFLATPHLASAELVPELLERGLRVFDLSAAFRLSDPAAYPAHYGFEHPAPALLEQAVYGLAEHAADRLIGARLVAVPGCYPTGSILATRPLAEAGLIEPGWRPIIDATSGVSGAGRSAQQRTLFCEVSQSPYGVPSHRHAPEIAEHAGVGERDGGAGVIFTPHLGPFDRGILATIHLRLVAEVPPAAVAELYTERYTGRPFVRLLGNAAEGAALPSVAGVRHTNFCDIAWHLDDTGHLRVFTAIDNLVKGASGQAVQSLNLAMGWDERLGLLPVPAPAAAAAGADS